EEINYYYNKYKPNKNFIELRNIAFVSKAIIESSLLRQESRGAYYNEDFPKKSKAIYESVFNRYLENAVKRKADL
ncbi:MAG: hypothetical protein ACP5SD_04345, partial [Elusimicrobiales bacterium]